MIGYPVVCFVETSFLVPADFLFLSDYLDLCGLFGRH